ncbi:S8 family serine peptidase [Lysobacter gummosus]|uniref:S8 family serine peptidase n=1 Tax=Lysobacter gummosus TaxID=262324 RepID=A0ABY3X9X9_9GAMM|nr:S8 family serine peptidase [Lysobacter gummosus]ALN93953.1 subtilisin Carlsberg [Lysobacter gummosus]UNP29399.1 S8 family serine peptidase [Lysobacter gummosus]
MAITHSRHPLAAALVAAISLGLSGLAAAAQQVEPSFPSEPQSESNRVWIRYASGQKTGIKSLIQQKVDALRSAVAANKSARSARLIGAKTHYEFDNLNAVVMTLPAEVVAGLRGNKNLIVEEDPLRYPMGEFVPYGVPAVQAPDVVAAGVDGTGVKVCVIDSGLRASHEDFAGLTLSGYAPTGKTWNSDTCGHGTHVAGTIAAVGNNGKGVIGVSPGKVSLHIVKYFDGPTCGHASFASSLVDAANRCAQAGAKVINMSLGGPLSSSLESNAFAKLLSQGVLSVAAAGNSGNSSKSYPASYASVLSVAAIDANQAKASFSQFNDAVDIAAPGVDISSTYPVRGTPLTVGADSFPTLPLGGSASSTVSGALVDGGLCTAAGSWSGKIVLCARGQNTVTEKVGLVKSGGAVGMVLANNVNDPFPISGRLASSVTISLASVSKETGQQLLTRVGQAATLNPTPVYDVDSYAVMSGTSMASPHVAGVAALLFAAKPSATPTQVREAITSSALDLGAPGRDNEYGAGMVRAFEALDRLTSTSASAPN